MTSQPDTQVLDELTKLLGDMIRINTTNPPGNERVLAEFLRDTFMREGIKAEVLESAPGRGSVVARLPGDGSKKPVIFLNHIDVVPAEKDKWSVDPFSGIVKDGCVWGRGALDIKGMGAMQVMAMLRLKREGARLKRDLVYIGAADEETGGAYGVEWLAKKHPEIFNAEYVINEGGFCIPENGRLVFYNQCAEKGIVWIKATVKGKGGHASLPHDENPLLLLAKGIEKLNRNQFRPEKNPINTRILSELSKIRPLPVKIAAKFAFNPILWKCAMRVLSKDKRLNSILRNTATPTVVKGGEKTNVIPSEVELVLDCRVFPGTDTTKFKKELENILGPDIKLEIMRDHGGTESAIDTELWSLLRDVLKEKKKDALFLPYLSAGGTDSGALRPLGITCYGFDPTITTPEEADTVHGIDERIPLESLRWGAEVLYETAKRFCS